MEDNFIPPHFWVQPSQQSPLKIFVLPQQFGQFRLRQGNMELESLVRTDTVLISPIFLKILAVIAGLTITDSLSLRLRKLMYCRQQSLMKILAIGMANYPIHFFPYPQSIVITCIPYLYPHMGSHFPENQLLNLILILSLAFSYTIHAPLHSYIQK